MAGFQSFFSNSSTVKKLIGWRPSDEDESWSAKAVESLLKKLKNKKEDLENLKFALTNPGQPSNCVTIPRSIDGRLQISHKKALPHLIYCKVWRWPDLQSHHELRSIESCRFPFVKKEAEVCINPYHYVRIMRPTLPPVFVPRFAEGTPSVSDPYSLDERYERAPNVALPNAASMDFQNTGFGGFSNNNIYSQPEYSGQFETHSYIQSPPHTPPLQPMGYGQTSISDVTPVQYPEPQNWATISYYELNQSIKDGVFNVRTPSIQVDGFTNPSNNERFSLGQLSNLHRNSTIENTRKHIGKGAVFWYVGGEVFTECLSDQAIFVQSSNCNFLHNLNPNSVIKITPGSSLKLFNEQAFAQILSQTVNEGKFESVYELTKMCTIRVSFVKGWGLEYKRPEITSTPCWIEIKLHGPLQWLDKVLSHMGNPTNPISSMS